MNSENQILDRLGIEAKIGVDTNIVYAEPDGMVRLAHIVYMETSRNQRHLLRSLDYFIDGKTGLSGVLTTSYPVDPILEAKAGVRYTIPKNFAYAVDLVRGIAAAHIQAHLGARYTPATLPDLETAITYVDKVVPSAPITVRHARLRDASKQKMKRSCRYDLDIDLSKGCVAATDADGYADPSLACSYCYGCANRLGAHEVFAVDSPHLCEQLKRLSRARDLEDRSTRTVCVGVKSDPGSAATRKELLAFLLFCEANGVVPVVRTKFLQYSRSVSKALKKCGGVLVISFGNDELELGAVAHGRTQDARFRDGLRYLRDGVHVVASVVVDPAQPDGGPLFAPVLSRVLKKFPRAIMYALRAKTKAIAKRAFGADFETRTAPAGFLMYERHGGEYVTVYVHPTVKKIIGRNRGACRLCLKSAAGEYCGACHIPGEKGVVPEGLGLSFRWHPWGEYVWIKPTTSRARAWFKERFSSEENTWDEDGSLAVEGRFYDDLMEQYLDEFDLWHTVTWCDFEDDVPRLGRRPE